MLLEDGTISKIRALRYALYGWADASVQAGLDPNLDLWVCEGQSKAWRELAAELAARGVTVRLPSAPNAYVHEWVALIQAEGTGVAEARAATPAADPEAWNRQVQPAQPRRSARLNKPCPGPALPGIQVFAPPPRPELAPATGPVRPALETLEASEGRPPFEAEVARKVVRFHRCTGYMLQSGASAVDRRRCVALNSNQQKVGCSRTGTAPHAASPRSPEPALH